MGDTDEGGFDLGEYPDDENEAEDQEGDGYPSPLFEPVDAGVLNALVRDLMRRRGEMQITIQDEEAVEAYGEAELKIERLPGLNATRLRLIAREQEAEPKTEPAAGG